MSWLFTSVGQSIGFLPGESQGLGSLVGYRPWDHKQSEYILMRKADSFEKTLMLGKIEGRRRRGQQKMRWLDGGGGAPRDSAGSGATEEGLTSRGGS